MIRIPVVRVSSVLSLLAGMLLAAAATAAMASPSEGRELGGDWRFRLLPGDA